MEVPFLSQCTRANPAAAVPFQALPEACAPLMLGAQALNMHLQTDHAMTEQLPAKPFSVQQGHGQEGTPLRQGRAAGSARQWVFTAERHDAACTRHAVYTGRQLHDDTGQGEGAASLPVTSLGR